MFFLTCFLCETLGWGWKTKIWCCSICTCPRLHRIQSHWWWKGSACGLQRSPEVRVHLWLDVHFRSFPLGRRKKSKPSARSKVSQKFCILSLNETASFCFALLMFYFMLSSCHLQTGERTKAVVCLNPDGCIPNSKVFSRDSWHRCHQAVYSIMRSKFM